MFCQVGVAVPTETTWTVLARCPRMLVRTSPETFLWGVSRDQLHVVHVLLVLNGHVVLGIGPGPISGRSRASECSAWCITLQPSVPERAIDVNYDWLSEVQTVMSRDCITLYRLDYVRIHDVTCLTF